MKVITASKIAIVLSGLFLSQTSYALKLMAMTWDNDIFVGQDSGYTNGLYFSVYRVGGQADNLERSGLVSRYDSAPKPGLILKPFTWLLPDNQAVFSVDAYSFGQVMITPTDLELSPPDPSDLPYAGQTTLSNIYVSAGENLADTLGVSIGVIGPSSKADKAQKTIHKLTNSKPPLGWEYQVKDRIVFQVSRGRVWRMWTRNGPDWSRDLIVNTEINLGSVEAYVSGTAVWRVGNDLLHTYISPAFNATRTNNPISVEGGGFFYAGFTASYIPYQYLIEGDTPYNNQAKLEHTQFGVLTGITYSWKYLAVTMALEEYLLQGEATGASRFGTLTLAWRI